MGLRPLLAALVLSIAAPAAFAGAAPFDLAGPSLKVEVAHGGATLPIAEVPNLSPGDVLEIRPDFPPGDSARYLLVVAFLRGAADPPPPQWFHRLSTWERGGRQKLTLTVPEGAQQAVLFLAPAAGGGYAALVDAVRGRPGAFVRASQDLNQAFLDRSRLDVFLAALRARGPADPEGLKHEATLLARSLMIKLDLDCFAKMPELEAACLMQDQDQLVLDDGHSTSIVEALTSGPAADLVFQLSVSPAAGFGYYSPYVAAVMDIARIFDSLRNPRYQYIPAVPTERGDRISLLLNAPPSFHDPLSVLVTALPAVAPAQPPPLARVDPDAAYCADRTDLTLPVEGAPLAFSTAYAHAMALKTTTRDGRAVELPVRADAGEGGFVADASGLKAADLADGAEARLVGDWGFTPFEGPNFRLERGGQGGWTLAAGDERALVVGRSDTVSLTGPAAACVADVRLQTASGETKVGWKVEGPDRLAVTLPLADASAGPVTLLIRRYGASAEEQQPLTAYAESGRLSGFAFHAGDAFGVLTGARLDEVAGLSFERLSFRPSGLVSSGGADALTLAADDPAAAAALKAGQGGAARVLLEDGRTETLRVQVGAPRPRAALLAKSIEPADPGAPAVIALADPDEAPASGLLAFSVRAESPTRLGPRTAIEVATADGGSEVTLKPGAGLTIADPSVAVGRVDLGRSFGTSAYGPLRFRVTEGGAAGDWAPLVTLVRLPALAAISCPAGRDRPCALAGRDLFLIAEIADNRAFQHPAEVPEGFPGGSLQVPHPTGGKLYVKLHDAPAVTDVVDAHALEGARAARETPHGAADSYARASP